uniref:FecR family protein n=1 Tax=uncultured Draconibacterium sp. TaxID=1573823 RepID=UPI003216FE08
MKNIITKYLNGCATVAEQVKLLVWLRQKENRTIFDSHKLDWKKGLERQQLPKGSEKSWNVIQDLMLQKSYNGWQNSRKTTLFFKVAAIFFFVLSLGSAIYFIVDQNKTTQEYFTSVVAENGQVSKVQLPDGSTVWLNSGSEISYNNFFAANNRNVTLSGEAYFQVTKNEEIPMVVSSGELQVKVLGTKFNVSAYPTSKKIDVVLESGKVELLSSEVTSFQYSMNPGELASFSKIDRKLAVNSVNTGRYTSWKGGMINIYDQSLEELVKRLEKRYNQEFEYSDELKEYHFTFTIKNEPLDEIIHIIERIAPIKAVQKNDVVEFILDKERMRKVDD